MCFLVDLLILLMDLCIFIQESSLSIARNQQIFSVKSQVVNIWGFADRVICVTTTRLCHCNMKAAMGNTHMNGHSPVTIKIYKNRKGDWMWPGGHGLPTLVLEDQCKHSWWFLLRLFFGLLSAWTCMTFCPGILSRKAQMTLSSPCFSKNGSQSQSVPAWGSTCGQW